MPAPFLHALSGVRRVGHRPHTGWGPCERTLMSQSVAVAGSVQDGKRGELFGGALTDEALDSSKSVLGTNRGGGLQGLQQFYTPPEAAKFIKEAIDSLGRSRGTGPHGRQRGAARAVAARTALRRGDRRRSDTPRATTRRSTATCSALSRCCASSGCNSHELSPTRHSA